MESTTFTQIFSGVTEFRQRGMCRYSIPEVLTISLFAMVCNCNDAVEIAAYGAAKIDFLRTILPNLKNSPSHDTIDKIFQNIDKKEFLKCLLQCSQILGNYNKDEYSLIFDGKVCRGTGRKRSKDGKRARKNDGICIVSAWSSEARVVLGQLQVGAKTNEKTAIPELIATMDIQGAIVSIDAVLCTPAIAEQIIDKGGNYILAVKGGNKHLLEEVSDWIERPNMQSFEQHKNVDYVGGRIEQRTCTCTQNIAELAEPIAYKACKTIFKIDSVRELGKGTTLRRETDTRYYITSLDKNAEELNGLTRSHWSIENQLHWYLDVVFGEDASQTRTLNAPENYNTLRKMALQILSHADLKGSIKVRRAQAGWNDNLALDMISQFFVKATQKHDDKT
jgi:predicted transposase YbfD/YdcC